MSTLPEHKKDIKKIFCSTALIFFYLCWMVVFFLQLKIGQSKSFEKASQSQKMVGVFRNTKEILVYKQCSLNAAQFKLALQIYQTCDIILSVNYMSSRIK